MRVCVCVGGGGGGGIVLPARSENGDVTRPFGVSANGGTW